MKKKESKSETKKNSKTETANESVQKTISVTEWLEKIQATADSMIALVEGMSDEKLLNPENDEYFQTMLDAFQNLRKHTHDSDNPDADIIANAVGIIVDKTNERFAAILQAAAERSPELVRKRKPPEFEMPPEYNAVLQMFIETVERRDALKKRLKFVPLKNRERMQQNLAEMERIIEEAEAAFAVEYEYYQKFKLYEDGFRKLLKTGSKKELAELRNHLKKNPTHNGVLERILRDEFPE